MQQTSDKVKWPDCRDFYELMQRYRHWPIEDQPGTAAAYEAVIAYIRSRVKPLLNRIERVCYFDWSDNDADAVRAIDRLAAELRSWRKK